MKFLESEPFSAPPWIEPRTAYIHIPFCAHHCGYCDFAVAVGQDHLADLYLEALELELQSLIQPRTMESLFIGGGTPSHLSAQQLQRLMSMMNHWFIRTSPSAEYSIEANPESLTEEKCAALAAGGISRISLGVQSFQNHLLRSLDRQHQGSDIEVSVANARKHVRSVSLDLIFAAPGAMPDDWQRDLERALALQPDHLSTYGLTYEKGTPLWKQRERGTVLPLAEEAELAMYETAIEILESEGFEHYEISNFAKSGHRCQHNERYWANEAYYGFGVGAARYVEGHRQLNTRNTNEYIRRLFAGESPLFQTEFLEGIERAFETLAIQLRRMEGIDRSHFQLQTGYELDALAGTRLRNLVQQGLLNDNGLSVSLTRRGKALADGVIEDLLKAKA